MGNGADLTTNGNAAYGLLAQSIGGGGGDAGFLAQGLLQTSTSSEQLSVRVGGHGGANDNGGAVTVVNTAQVQTLGLFAPALAAQSIGGGGGNAALAFIGQFDKGTATVAGVAVGGAGAGVGNGGNISLTNSGLISTGTTTPQPGGEFSIGILAQSIGADGGNGNLLLDLGVPTSGTATTGTVAVHVGGGAGQSGIGGTVTVTDKASIQTAGAEAIGIEAQSIGGGGGNGAATVDGTAQLTAGQSCLDLRPDDRRRRRGRSGRRRHRSA